MLNPKQKAAEAAAYLISHLDASPEVGVIIGTGLSDTLKSLQAARAVSYHQIPHFPTPTVTSHTGRLLSGMLYGRRVLVMQGRFHLYEGFSAQQVIFPIRVMRELGVSSVVITNAAGGLNPMFRPGDIMAITDHINLTGENPLVGPNEDSWGPRFPDMSRTYDPKLIQAAHDAAADAGVSLQRGVYAGLKGPSLETPAEARFLQTIGADAVGFSTVQEVIAGMHCGMRILGFSILTNVHDPYRPQPADLDDIIATAGQAAPNLQALIQGVLARL